MAPKTNKTMAATKTTAPTKSVRQPVGTNHFQFRCHQLRRAGGVGGGGVEGDEGEIGGGTVGSMLALPYMLWKKCRG
jgi:hypothetical protein